MKKWRFMLPFAAAVLMVAALLCACGSGAGEPVKISVIDCGQSVAAEGTDDMTVRQLVEQAGLTLARRDSVVPEPDVRWRDAGESAIVIRRYAKVHVIVENNGKTIDAELIGGTVGQAIKKAGYNEGEYKTDADLNAYLTDGMEIRINEHREGFISSGKKAYFYDQDGNLQKDGIVGSDSDGFWYADSEGEIDLGYCDGVNVNGEDWIITNGAATKVVSEADGAWYSAAQAIAKCTQPGMSKDTKLRKAFDYIKTAYLEGVRHNPPYQEMDWPVVCANDLFIYGKGDCFSYGAAYAYMAKAIGCEECYACNTGGHGWAEVDGKFYDPEWDMHNHDYNHFAVSPDDDCDVNYVTSITEGVEWMRIRV